MAEMDRDLERTADRVLLLVVERVEVATGMPGNPVPDGELAGKFLDLAVPVLGREKAERLLEQVWAIDKVEDCSRLVALATL